MILFVFCVFFSLNERSVSSGFVAFSLLGIHYGTHLVFNICIGLDKIGSEALSLRVFLLLHNLILFFELLGCVLLERSSSVFLSVKFSNNFIFCLLTKFALR